MRFFNTAGPVREDKHYTISPLTRIQISAIERLIEQEKYFVLHAPQRCQKEMEGVGEGSLVEFLSEWVMESDRPVVLLIDEIDALIGDTLISVLRQLRSGYDKRPAAFPQSIILCGVRDVRDYRIHSSRNKEIITGGSAFNIKAGTHKTRIKSNDINPDSNIFYDAIVLLGTAGANQTKKPVRLIGYVVDGTKYWVASNRFDLSAEQIAFIYKLRWDVEKFFAWWKRHLKVYHLIARSEHGLMVQILAGLITYLLLAIYCRQQHNEKVSITRVRELRIKIQNEVRIGMPDSNTENSNFKEQGLSHSYAIT